MSIHPPSRNETASGILGASQAAAVANLAAGNVDTTHNQVLTAAQQAAVTTESAGWFATQCELMKVAAPGVSNFRAVDVLALLNLGGGFTDAGVQGGYVAVTSEWQNLTPRIFYNAAVTPWAIACKAILPAPVTGSSCGFGVSDAAANMMFMRSYYDTGVISHTDLLCQGSTDYSHLVNTWAIDGLAHSLIIASDTVHLRFFIDGVAIPYQLAIAGNVTAGPLKINVIGHVAPFVLSDLAYAW